MTESLTLTTPLEARVMTLLLAEISVSPIAYKLRCAEALYLAKSIAKHVTHDQAFSSKVSA